MTRLKGHTILSLLSGSSLKQKRALTWGPEEDSFTIPTQMQQGKKTKTSEGDSDLAEHIKYETA